MRSHVLFALFLCLVFSAGAQQTQVTDHFDAIKVFGPFDVEIIPAEKPRVEIRYDGYDRNDLVAEVHAGQLELRLRNRTYLNNWDNDWDHNLRTISVKVFQNNLTEIEAEAGARVRSRETLHYSYLELSSSMGAEIELEISAEKVKASSSMGGEIRLAGTTGVLDATASMGAELDASFLKSKTVSARSSMGARVRVQASEEIEANAMFGGQINYSGPATTRHTNTTFGGSVYSD